MQEEKDIAVSSRCYDIWTTVNFMVYSKGSNREEGKRNSLRGKMSVIGTKIDHLFKRNAYV